MKKLSFITLIAFLIPVLSFSCFSKNGRQSIKTQGLFVDSLIVVYPGEHISTNVASDKFLTVSFFNSDMKESLSGSEKQQMADSISLIARDFFPVGGITDGMLVFVVQKKRGPVTLTDGTDVYELFLNEKGENEPAQEETVSTE